MSPDELGDQKPGGTIQRIPALLCRKLRVVSDTGAILTAQASFLGGGSVTAE